MQAIRRFERVEGTTLTIDVPEEFLGRDVEVVVLVVEAGANRDATLPENEPIDVPWLLPKPPINEGSRRVMERQAAGISDPAFRFDDPFAPVVSDEDLDFEFPATQQSGSCSIPTSGSGGQKAVRDFRLAMPH